jgi:hypothetical protein
MGNVAGVNLASGIDYAWQHPSIQSLVDWGATFVCRYVSPAASKNETLAEAQRLASRGIWSVLVYESTAGRAKAGTAAGASDARRALALARGMHMPEDRPIYFAVDYDVQNLAEIEDYFHGVNSVLGNRRTGIYGGLKAVRHIYNLGLAKYVWQTYAWSGSPTVWFTPSHIQQYHNDINIGGVGVDANRATVKDYGQWKPDVSPTPAPPVPPAIDEEEFMYGGMLEEGPGAETMIALPKGKYSTIGFSCDNTRTGKPPANLRVAIASPNFDVLHITVDGSKGQTVVTFPDKTNTIGISILRDDKDAAGNLIAGDVRVGFEVS